MGKNPYASSSFHQSMMISQSSSIKPILNDQDYMELVCENGQILAKGRRRSNDNDSSLQRRQSLLDLYETEYEDEGFKKEIKNLGDTQIVPVSESHHEENDELSNNIKKKDIESERDVSKSNKLVESTNNMDDDFLKGSNNIEVITNIPDEQSVAVGRSTELYFASSSMFSRGSLRDLSCCSLKKRYGDIEEEEEEEESTYLSNNSDDESDEVKTQVPTRTKRKRSKEVHKLSERKRRNEINKKMRTLQDLIPNCYKDDKASLLDEAIIYMRTLQLQVQLMSMGNGLLQPPTMLPMGHYSPMGLGMHMDATSIPQFMPMNVQGTGFSGMNNASPYMLSFLNHPTGLVPNSPIFSPLMENCSQQFVVPSCDPHTQTTQFPKSDSTSNLEDVMQFRGSNGF